MKKVSTFISHFISSRFPNSYHRNLIAFLLLTSLPGLLFSTLLFTVSKSQMEKELEDVHQNHLYHTMESIKDQFSSVELILASWATNEFGNNYNNVDTAYGYSEVRELYKTLLSMEESNSLIGRVELYLNRPEEMVFTKNGYEYLGDKVERERYESMLSNSRSLFWNHSLMSLEEGYGNKYASLNLVHNLPSNSRAPYGSLVVLLNKQALLNLMKSPYEGGSSFLLRNQDEWVFDNEKQTAPTNLEEAVMEEINSSSNIEPFLFQWENMKYTVTYSDFSRLGEKWYYVSLAPLTTITGPVVFISKLFIVFSLIVLTIAILLSIFVSRRLYAPLEALIEKVSGDNLVRRGNEFELIETQWNDLAGKSENLQNRLESQRTHLREGFLLQLVQGYLYSYQENNLRERMQHYGWETNKRKYVVLYIQMFGFSKLRGKFLEGDEGLVTFLAANIIEELIEKLNIEADVVNFHDLSLGLLVSYEEDKPSEEADTEILRLSKDIIACVNKTCHMDVSIGISKKTESISTIHSIFEETKNSLSLRSLQDKNQIIELEKAGSLTAGYAGFKYPFELEKEILHAIRLRNKEKAIQLSHSFFSALSEENVNEAMMKQGALQLLGSIFHIVLQSELMEDFGEEGINMHEQLYELKDPDEVSEWFEKKIILPVIQHLSEKQDQHLRLVVEKVVLLLQENYSSDISLDYCADQVNLNPAILSKVFKEISGWNFIDYLTNIRLTKAKELLIETDEKIKDIAESIGYRHSYFNRLFKKHEGITPSEFRSLTRKKVM